MIRNMVLNIVMPKIDKLLQPINKYINEPNNIDAEISDLKQETEAAHDVLVDVGKTANKAESDIEILKASIKSIESSIESFSQKFENIEAVGTRIITLQAMVDKFDRDQDYLEQRIKDVVTTLETIVNLKGDK
jgi:prefoldin subunit 5